MRYDITKQKLDSLVQKAKASGDLKDINLLRGYVKTEMINNKKSRSAHKLLDSIQNLTFSEQLTRCVDGLNELYNNTFSEEFKKYDQD